MIAWPSARSRCLSSRGRWAMAALLSRTRTPGAGRILSRLSRICAVHVIRLCAVSRRAEPCSAGRALRCSPGVFIRPRKNSHWSRDPLRLLHLCVTDSDRDLALSSPMFCFDDPCRGRVDGRQGSSISITGAVREAPFRSQPLLLAAHPDNAPPADVNAALTPRRPRPAWSRHSSTSASFAPLFFGF